jgi:ubiquinone/menaquinone biosynthesis C-methylase UbiE
MDVLDYGCGTGLLSLFLLPHFRSVTGADSSVGMLDVLKKKIAEMALDNMDVMRLDLEHDSVPEKRFHLVATAMTMHHVRDTDKVLRAFYDVLHPGGVLCVADLDTEAGVFHPANVAETVHHHGFDRDELKKRMHRIGFIDTRDVTAHTIRKEVEEGQPEDFPVFLVVARRVG